MSQLHVSSETALHIGPVDHDCARKVYSLLTSLHFFKVIFVSSDNLPDYLFHNQKTI